ncbi:MAG: hypothetical protein ISP71_07345 [Flavobacteriales bacterium]|nr:hypothetical protein [Flavobacteriales bacterium]
MKTKIALPLLFLIFIFSNLNAQIENEIKSFSDSTTEFVNNGRKLLIQSIAKEDYEKAKEISQYLTEYTADKAYSAFYYLENLNISLLTSDFSGFLEKVENYEKYKNQMLYPDSYEIGNVLQKEIYNKKENILSNLKKTSIESEGKRIIDIYLHQVIEGSKNEEYSKLLRNYKSDFPETKYSEFVQKGLPKKHNPAYFTYTFGTGGVGLTNNLKNTFSTNLIFNMSMDLRINKVFASFYLNTTNFKVKTPFFGYSDNNESVNFELNESITYFKRGIFLGYFTDNSERLNFAPYINLSATSLESNKFEPSEHDKEYVLINNFTYGVGCRAEIKIAQFDAKYPYYGMLSPKHHFALALNVGYDIISQSDEFFEGNLYYANIGIVWGFGDF